MKESRQIFRYGYYKRTRQTQEKKKGLRLFWFCRLQENRGFEEIHLERRLVYLIGHILRHHQFRNKIPDGHEGGKILKKGFFLYVA